MIIKVCGMRDGNNIREIEALGVDLIGMIFYEKSPRYVSERPTYLPHKAKSVGVFVDAEPQEIISRVRDYGLGAIQLHGHESPTYIRHLKQALGEADTSSRTEMQELGEAITSSRTEMQELGEAITSSHTEMQELGEAETSSRTEMQELGEAIISSRTEMQAKDGNSPSLPAIKIIKAIGISDEHSLDGLEEYDELVDAFVFDTYTPQKGGSGETFNHSLLKEYHGRTPFLLSGGLSLNNAAEILSLRHPKLIGFDINSRFETAPAQKDPARVRQFVEMVKKRAE